MKRTNGITQHVREYLALRRAFGFQHVGQLVDHYEGCERRFVDQILQHVVQVAEMLRCGVSLTSTFGLRLFLKGAQENGFHGSWVGLKGQRKLQNLNRDVAKWIMGRQLIFDHIQPGLLPVKVEQIAVGYGPDVDMRDVSMLSRPE